MTREEAIKNIKEHCYFANLIPQAKEAIDMAIEALKQEPRWVPVGERLPKDEDYYLVTDDAGGMKTVEISFFVPDCEAPWDYVNVTAWMPLPKPYTEVRNSDD